MVDPHQQAENEEQAARLKGLIEISRSLNSTPSLRSLFHHILVAAQELTETEACSIRLVDPGSGQLYFEAAMGTEGYRVRSITLPMKGSIAGWVARTNEPLIVSDIRKDPRFRHQARALLTASGRAVLAVPLVAQDSVIGVLEAVDREAKAGFTEEDIQLLSILANEAAMAVQSAVLFRQSGLISEIVHEMRTPLTSIIAYTDLMQRPDTTSSQRHQFADIIRHEAERLSDMAADFLDLAQLESGHASFARDPVDLNTVIRMAVAVLMPQSLANQIELTVDIPETLPPVAGDAQRLHQVMLNLLDNALKYCRPGDEVTITARSEERHLTVNVADTGPGVPVEALSHIFERFYRVPKQQEQTSGSGLGLAITRRIIEAHGGRVRARSDETEGTMFTFTLPVQSAQ